jgi:alkylhydroperoxidase/carboxymuconolactone decarboxylase family protein YurZ
MSFLNSMFNTFSLSCIEGHVRAAKKAGATDQEIAEAIFVAAALRAGGAFAHSTISMGVLKEMERSAKEK